MNTTTYTIWGNNSQVSRSYELTISVAENTNDTVIDDTDDGKESESKLIYALCCLPVIHILSFINFAMRNTDLISETAFYQLSGLILIAEGLFFTYYSSNFCH